MGGTVIKCQLGVTTSSATEQLLYIVNMDKSRADDRRLIELFQTDDDENKEFEGFINADVSYSQNE